MYVHLCMCLPEQNRLNLIYSPKGHLLTESNPLTGPRRNGSLTRLLLYIAAVMGIFLETLVLLICARLPRFEEKMPNILHTSSLHRETPDALQLRRINQSTYSQLSHLSACCLPGCCFLSGCAWGCTRRAYCPCLTTYTATERKPWLNGHSLHAPFPFVDTFRSIVQHYDSLLLVG